MINILSFKLGKAFLFEYKRNWILIIVFAVSCVCLTVLLDHFEARFAYSGFYISESLLFSSFWLLFIPLLYLQQKFSIAGKTKARFAFLLFIPIVVHLFAYPAIVWLISKLFFDHTFTYWQTFRYGLTEYFFTMSIAYVLNGMLSVYLANESKERKRSDLEKPVIIPPARFASTWLVKANSTNVYIHTKDIRLFSANSPYVTIHYQSKKYLQFETLKSVLEKVDNSLFVQVHKSTLVNLSFVTGYTPRQNGDYDLTMDNGAIVRLSRNYATDFKTRFEAIRSH
jgi:DNA-binding LytR/AlgR family response regulator